MVVVGLPTPMANASVEAMAKPANQPTPISNQRPTLPPKQANLPTPSTADASIEAITPSPRPSDGHLRRQAMVNASVEANAISVAKRWSTLPSKRTPSPSPSAGQRFRRSEPNNAISVANQRPTLPSKRSTPSPIGQRHLQGQHGRLRHRPMYHQRSRIR